ncbi:hypothetical protein [Dyella sp.]|jgi:hypothetical protein|uniref:hypothetical protein n=1 Tax=Dyella sp. TaxID=1869338 RepID=UPI002FD8BA8F
MSIDIPTNPLDGTGYANYNSSWGDYYGKIVGNYNTINSNIGSVNALVTPGNNSVTNAQLDVAASGTAQASLTALETAIASGQSELMPLWQDAFQREQQRKQMANEKRKGNHDTNMSAIRNGR